MNRADEFRNRARLATFRRWEIENRLTSMRLALAERAYVDCYGPRGLGANEIDLSIARANRTPDAPCLIEQVGTSTARTLASVRVTNPSRFLAWYGARLLARQTADAIADRSNIVDGASALVDHDYVTGHALADVERRDQHDGEGLHTGTSYVMVPRDASPDWYQYLTVKPHQTRAIKTYRHTAPVITSRLTRSTFGYGAWRVFVVATDAMCELVHTFKPGEIDRVANWSTASRGYAPSLTGYVNVVNVPEDVYLASSRDPGGYCQGAALLNRQTLDVFKEAGEHMPAPDEFNVRHMRYLTKPDTVAFRGVQRWQAGSPVRVEHGAKKVEGKLVPNLDRTHRGVDGQYELRTALQMSRVGLVTSDRKGWLGHRYVTFVTKPAGKAKQAEQSNGDRQALETSTRKGPHVTAFGLSQRSLARAQKRVIRESDTLTILAQSLGIGQGVTFDNGTIVTSLGAQVLHHDLRGGVRAFPIREWAIRAALAGMASMDHVAIEV